MNPLPTDTQTKRDPRAINAYRHGLTGQVYLFTDEERAAYESHCELIHKGLAPVGDMETQLAQTVADHRWRLSRAIAMEANIFSMGIADSPNIMTGQHPEAYGAISMGIKWLKDDKSIARLSLYLHRIQRDVEKSTQMFHELQQARLNALKQAAEEARLLAQLAESKGESYNPGADFPADVLPPQFVFSKAGIAPYSTHFRGLNKAKILVRQRQQFLKKAA